MSYGSPDSRRAAEFDSYRRELVLHSKTVAGERREQWHEKLKELVEAMFPGAETHHRKPGLATRMFSSEVAMPGRDKMHLLDLAKEMDDNWRASISGTVKSGASCVYLDRLDAMWEWAVDLGDSYVTGHVKLRNFNFDKAGAGREERDRPRFTPGRGRPPAGKSGDRPPRRFGSGPGRPGKPPFRKGPSDRPRRKRPEG